MSDDDQPVRPPASWWLIAGLVVALIGLIGAALGIAIGVGAEAADQRPGTTGITQSLPQQDADRLPPAAGTIAAVAAATLPAVVSIAVEGGGSAGTGSGFVIDAGGYIVTNSHVIEAAAESVDGTVRVVFSNGNQTEALIIGRNVSADVAVIQVTDPEILGGQLAIVAWGESEALAVGDSVIAIGAPLGLAGTVTAGIVSSLDRPVTTGSADRTAFINAIQIDAAINPGNSGGPLLNSEGRVVGVNSAVATLAAAGGSGSIGLGFAIPADSAERIVNEIIETGTSATPVIGVVLDVNFAGAGALIEEVTAGGPAANAGIQPGDVITAVDGRPVTDARTLVIAIRSNAPGDSIVLTVNRAGQQEQVSVILAGDQRD
ncbi:MAG: trypsin-like peptidase domain-containing protein [Candidatus Nanopelagicales bacterium]|nr:trypsin-like peptidase domain-containing protein [Candidatus Nanopelagicales bacterium]MDP4824743.1 trypsin-like peptidase domain-containing protein [Candidatus Nanopelagicales bacterium]MDP4888584.1 trypsin-like peptidase domain-containing protein [Candidatus Nanopelagicales bacterium]